MGKIITSFCRALRRKYHVSVISINIIVIIIIIIYRLDQLSDACSMMVRVIEVPVSNDSLPFLFTGLGEELNLTNLQKTVMSNITQLQKLAIHKVNQDKFNLE